MQKTKFISLLIILLAFSIRFFLLGKVPISLYWDEASLGFNAYTISQTLRDEHGEFLPISNFIAFGDFKAPFYIYADTLSVKLLGRTEFAVRLPSAVAGLLMVVLAYLLTFELFKRRKMALVSAFVVAISPWSVQMSRGAFEANVAALFSGFAIYLFIKKKLVLSAILFAVSLYTFNSQRVFVPMMISVLFFIYIKEIWKEKVRYIIFAILLTTFLLPLVPHMLSREGKLRFNEVTWLNDLAVVQESNKLIASNNGALWAKIIYNRRVFYGQMFATHYLDNFRPDFLFVKGDINQRLSIQGVGEMYWFEALFAIFGLGLIIKKRNRISLVLLSWLLLAPVPAALARETPHALRILNVLPVPQILVTLGIICLIKKWRILMYITIAMYVFGTGYYQNYYYKVYANSSAEFWQYGYKELVSYCEEAKGDYDNIYVTDYYGRPYIYFLFYGQQNLETYWRTRDFGRDWYGFRFVYGFDKYHFNFINNQKGHNLYVLAPSDNHLGSQLVKTIKDPYGKIIFEIYKDL